MTPPPRVAETRPTTDTTSHAVPDPGHAAVRASVLGIVWDGATSAPRLLTAEALWRETIRRWAA